MPRQTEPNANNALGDLLRGMMQQCEVRAENTQTFTDHPGRHADVLITSPGRSPVVVEAEYEPASEVDKDARERLGLRVAGEPRTVEAAIALRYPESIEEAYEVREAVAEARLAYYVLHQNEGNAPTRFPESGWLEGAVNDLADLVRLVSVPQREVEVAADRLQAGIEAAADILDQLEKLAPVVPREMAQLLGMSDVLQTRRMACAIIANAMVFQERIAGIHDGVKPLQLVCGPDVGNPQAATLEAWTAILEINYWPIFAIARDLLGQLPSEYAAQILAVLRDTAQGVSAAGVTSAHDLTGRIFQRLIADRKYLATFYTLPTSAALLARLAVAKLKDVDWADPDAIGKLRVGDFACGTGALLSAVYDEIAARYERAGGDPAGLHTPMMEDVLYGCDVMPSAAHITSATLSGAQPTIGFNQSRIYTMPYGRQKDGTVRIGSLELLQSSHLLSLFNTNDPALRTGSAGEETAAQINIDIPDASFDLVIMNPPFTRNVTREGATADAVAAAFAAFGASERDQRDMAKRMGELKGETCYHGNAGMASAFAALAHRKLRPGGVLALVLPLSSASGLAWQNFRQMMGTEYNDRTVVSIAANGKDMSFSSDTGMAECLVIARKMDVRTYSPTLLRTQFTSLRRRPQGFAHAAATARNIVDSATIRGIEDGPYGGTPLPMGEEISGEMLTAPQPDNGENWGSVRLLDYSLAQTAHALSQSLLWLPGILASLELKMAALGSVGKLGMYHLDITGPPPRGAFTKTATSPTATYPALWNHNAKKETRMVCAPDSQLQVRPGMESKAAAVWATASHPHLNMEFTFGSQALALAMTERETLGSSVWANVILCGDKFDCTFSVWSNSTLGLLAYWWHSSRQQSSKARVTIRAAETLPVLDFRTLSDGQLATGEAIFEEFRDKELKPAYLADADANRALLDRRVVCDLLGFDEEVYQGVRLLAAKWCAEPSVHGAKTRPQDAKLVM